MTTATAMQCLDPRHGAPKLRSIEASDAADLKADEKRYHLPGHVYACRTPAGVVFLDASKDRYSGMGGPEVIRLLNHIANVSSLDPRCSPDPEQQVEPERLERLAHTLVRRGLICSGGENDSRFPKDRPRLYPPRIDPPELGPSEIRRARLVDISNFLVACLRAAWSLRRLCLGDIASRISAARPSENPAELHSTVELARMFQRLRRWSFSGKDRCLFNSLALVYFLQRYRCYPCFVIGVQTTPFAAHAWVQKERIVLDGDPENVGHFTPILVA